MIPDDKLRAEAETARNSARDPNAARPLREAAEKDTPIDAEYVKVVGEATELLEEKPQPKPRRRRHKTALERAGEALVKNVAKRLHDPTWFENLSEWGQVQLIKVFGPAIKRQYEILQPSEVTVNVVYEEDRQLPEGVERAEQLALPPPTTADLAASVLKRAADGDEEATQAIRDAAESMGLDLEMKRQAAAQEQERLAEMKREKHVRRMELDADAR